MDRVVHDTTTCQEAKNPGHKTRGCLVKFPLPWVVQVLFKAQKKGDARRILEWDMTFV